MIVSYNYHDTQHQFWEQHSIVGTLKFHNIIMHKTLQPKSQTEPLFSIQLGVVPNSLGPGYKVIIWVMMHAYAYNIPPCHAHIDFPLMAINSNGFVE